MISLNINAPITTRLTERGRAAWYQYWTQRGSPFPSQQQPASDGTIVTELWTLMAALGPALIMGSENSIVDNLVMLREGECVRVEP
jgi:hypothetical protein